MRGLVRWGTHALVAAVAVTQSACGYLFVEFEYDREEGLLAGEVSGQAVRADLDDKPPAPYARVVAQGAGLVRRAGGDGKFSFHGLVPGPWVFRVEDDVDGDGWPERHTNVAALVRAGPKPSGLFGQAPEEVSAVLLGRVPVDGTVQVKGQVLVDTDGGPRPPSELGLVARVLVTREFDLPTGVADTFNTVSLGAEAQTAADSTGTFVFQGIGSGPFQVVAFLFENAVSPTEPGRLFGATAPLALRGIAGEVLDVTDAPLVVPAVGPAPLAGTRQVQVGLAPVPAGESYLIYVPQGREAPACDESPPPDYSATPFPWAARSEVGAWGADIPVELPFGAYDLYACTTAGTSGPHGVLYEVAVPPPEGDPAAALPVVVGPLLLAIGDACEAGSQRDCDGDELVGLPPFSPGSEDVWTACVQECRDAFGADNALATCTVGAETFDCDDDGDGQPDVTESPACYGLGRGTDLDGDGLCSGQDPFPQCRANNAVDCVAGEFDFTPQVPSAYGGSPFDPGFGGGDGIVSFGGEGAGDDEGVAVALDGQGNLLVVGTLFDGNQPSIAVWRLTQAGELDPAFGDGGVVLARSLTEGLGPSYGAGLAVEAETGDIYVAGTVEVETSTDLVLFSLSAADGSPRWAQPLRQVNLGEIGFGEATRETAEGLFLDEAGLWLVGAGVPPGREGAGVSTAFVCAHLSASGEPANGLLSNPNVPGCVYLENAEGQPTHAHSVARARDGDLVIAGQRGDESDVEKQAWLWTLTPGEEPVSFGLPVSENLGSSAREVLVVGDDVYVAGTDADDAGVPKLALWRQVDGAFSLLFDHRGAGSETFGLGLAADASGGLYVVGQTLRGENLDLVVTRYDPVRQAPDVLAEHDGAAGASGEDVGFGVVVDEAGRAVVVGKSYNGRDSDLALWRLLPAGGAAPPDGGAPDAGAPDAGAGGPPDAGGGDGSGLCADNSDCNDLGCDFGLVPMCMGSSGCSCQDVCDPNAPTTTVPPDGVVLVTGPGDLEEAVSPDTLCILGSLQLDGYAGFDFELPALRRITGSLVVVDPQQAGSLRNVWLNELHTIDANLDVVGNRQSATTPTGLETLYMPSLRWVAAARVVDNWLLPTSDVVATLGQVPLPVENVVISENGCDVLDRPLCTGEEVCHGDIAGLVDVCLLPAN